MSATIDLNTATVDDAKAYIHQLASELTVENTPATLNSLSELFQIERLHPAVTAVSALFRAIGKYSTSMSGVDAETYRRQAFDLAGQVGYFAEKYEREEREAGDASIRPVEAFSISTAQARYIVDAQKTPTGAERHLIPGYSIWVQEAKTFTVDFGKEVRVHLIYATRQADGRLLAAYYYPGSEAVEFSTANVNLDAKDEVEIRRQVLQASRVAA